MFIAVFALVLGSAATVLRALQPAESHRLTLADKAGLFTLEYVVLTVNGSRGCGRSRLGAMPSCHLPACYCCSLVCCCVVAYLCRPEVLGPGLVSHPWIFRASVAKCYLSIGSSGFVSLACDVVVQSRLCRMQSEKFSCSPYTEPLPPPPGFLCVCVYDGCVMSISCY